MIIKVNIYPLDEVSVICRKQNLIFLISQMSVSPSSLYNKSVDAHR